MQTILDALKAELPAHIRAAHEQAIKAGDLPVTPRKYLSYDEAAHYLGMTPKALRCAVEQGAGPRSHRPGDRKVVRFTVADLDAWMVARDSNA
ncbi:MAG: helix-turn-helix domain-containing protein [Steroidobacteraceae bacterium]|nr:helix-turn-helix domain-containing protein [Steroidobacteraceae bacterium]